MGLLTEMAITNCTVEEVFLTLVSYGGELISVLFAGAAMVLAWRMMRFAGMYDPKWRRSFAIFFSTTGVALTRRILAGLLLAGYDGLMGKLLNIIDHVFLMPLFSVLYAWFIWQNYTFWKGFSHRFLESSFKHHGKEE